MSMMAKVTEFAPGGNKSTQFVAVGELADIVSDGPLAVEVELVEDPPETEICEECNDRRALSDLIRKQRDGELIRAVCPSCSDVEDRIV